MQRSNSAFYFVSLIVIIVIASFFVSWRIIIPKYQKNKTDLKQLEQEVVAANTKVESLRTAKSDIDNLGPVLDQIFVSMPKDKDEPNIIAEIEAIASVNKLVVPGIQISDGSTPNATVDQSSIGGPVTVSFNAVGTFQDISNMTKALEGDLKFMALKNLAIASAADGLTASYQLEVYRFQSFSTLSDDAMAGASVTAEGGL